MSAVSECRTKKNNNKFIGDLDLQSIQDFLLPDDQIKSIRKAAQMN
jgi:hypothetical protein